MHCISEILSLFSEQLQEKEWLRAKTVKNCKKNYCFSLVFVLIFKKKRMKL